MRRNVPITVGWDIGGVATKAARLVYQQNRIRSLRMADEYFEIWKGKDRLPSVLRKVFSKLGPAEAMAVTMTAELSDVFPTKVNGVRYVVQCVQHAFPGLPLYGLDSDGGFVDLCRPLNDPLALAATNWLATAKLLAKFRPTCLLVDIGSTTTDVIPILGGRVVATGKNDTDRLLAGELVYTGVLRTPVTAITPVLPLRRTLCPVAAEYFAISGDVYRILGYLKPRHYSCPTPDGQGTSPKAARRRLARMVCAEAGILSEREVIRMARYVYEKQRAQVVEAMSRVARRHGRRTPPIITAGLGSFLACEAADALGCPVEDIAGILGRKATRHTPPIGTAYLLAEWLEKRKR
ncbi:MAG: hydantoinase/oxoprolinase family protein [Candidatus Methylomirabilales bacterium]